MPLYGLSLPWPTEDVQLGREDPGPDLPSGVYVQWSVGIATHTHCLTISICNDLRLCGYVFVCRSGLQ